MRMLIRVAVPIKYKWKTYIPLHLRQFKGVPTSGTAATSDATATSARPRPQQRTTSNSLHPTRPSSSPTRAKVDSSSYLDRTPSNNLPLEPLVGTSTILSLPPNLSGTVHAPYPTAQPYQSTLPWPHIPYTLPPALPTPLMVPQNVCRISALTSGFASGFGPPFLPRPEISDSGLYSEMYASVGQGSDWDRDRAREGREHFTRQQGPPWSSIPDR